MSATAATPNYTRGESRSGDLIAIVVCMTVLSTVVVAARIWSRVEIQGSRLGPDDWTIMVAWVFSLAFTGDVIGQTNYGLGKHLLDLPATTNFSVSQELFYFGEMIYYVAVSLTKVSILFLYLRLIPQKPYPIICYVLMAFVGLTGLSCVLANIFQCNPIHKAWDTTIDGTCFDQVALFLANAGLNIAQDFIIYILPIKRFWTIQLPKKQRIALVLVFGVGAFVCVTGILRLNSLTVASVSEDVTWDNYGAAIWSSIETNTGIVCACLVHLKPMIVRYMPSLLSIGRTTRLADERSGGTSDLRSSTKRSRKMGVMTEMELEENDEASIIQPTNHQTAIDTYSSHSDYSGANARNMNGQYDFGIHKTTQINISYGESGRM
ncbi:hypothetical protein M426DRAFT_21209 [Hypoxylon sp. CI-4A]|nr:hypothetical protein M426DRAFT_21209 [Hypoxylon sp. CI-4A]